MTNSSNGAVLLREWDLLQDHVIPPLLAIDDRVPTVWSVGSAEDAVAVAVAFNHASSHHLGIDVFASSVPTTFDPVTFSLSDIRRIPTASRGWFARSDSHYVPEPTISERVVLTEPSGGVDLLTVRADIPGAQVTDAMVDQLNVGGCLLVVSAPDDAVSGLSELQPVDGHRRVYRKRAQRRTRRRDTSPPSPGETLAHRQVRTELVHSHMGLARSLARRFSRRGEAIEDLEQVASVALVRAAQRYDQSLETAFSSYATASITGELKRHFRDKAWTLRVPRSVKDLYLSVKAAREELSHQLGAAPTPAQLAAYLNVEESDVLAALSAGDSYWPTSLDAPFSESEERNTQLPEVDAGFANALDRRQVESAMSELESTEQVVIRRVFFDEWTQRQVAAQLGVSQMQVSRLQARALAKLRRVLVET